MDLDGGEKRPREDEPMVKKDEQPTKYARVEEVFAPLGQASYDPKILKLAPQTIGDIVMTLAALPPSNNDLLLPLTMRGWTAPGILTENDKEVIKNSERNKSIVFGKLTKALKLALPEETYNRLYAKVVTKTKIETDDDEEEEEDEDVKGKRQGTLRSLFERSSATTQCNNTVGNQIPSSMCWICNTPIAAANQGFMNTAECEHVFPVMQALCFTGLYTSGIYETLKDQEDKNGKTRGDLYKQELYREYRWAHKICNQIKSDAHFVVIKNDDTFGIDEELIKALLNKILATPKYGEKKGVPGGPKLWEYINKFHSGKALDKKTALTRAIWVNQQASIIKKVCEEITNQANKLGYTTAEFTSMTVMKIREYVALDPEMSRPVYQELPRTVPTATPKSQLYSTNTSDILPVIELYARDIHRIVAGIVTSAINEVGLRGTGLNAIERAKLSGELSSVQIQSAFIDKLLPKNINAEGNEEIDWYVWKQLRHLIYIASLKSGGNVWSDIQTVFPLAVYAEIMKFAFLNMSVTFPAIIRIQEGSPMYKIFQEKAGAAFQDKIETVDFVINSKYGKLGPEYSSLGNMIANKQTILESGPATADRTYGLGRKTRKSDGKRNRKTYRR